jgi:hypothetical protein
MLQRDNVAERSASGGVILKFDNVLLMRGGRGTWLLDLQVHVGDAHRRLQVPIGRHKVFDRFASEIMHLENARDQTAGRAPSV